VWRLRSGRGLESQAHREGRLALALWPAVGHRRCRRPCSCSCRRCRRCRRGSYLPRLVRTARDTADSASRRGTADGAGSHRQAPPRRPTRRRRCAGGGGDRRRSPVRGGAADRGDRRAGPVLAVGGAVPARHQLGGLLPGVLPPEVVVVVAHQHAGQRRVLLRLCHDDAA
jgi:hypothetical protein